MKQYVYVIKGGIEVDLSKPNTSLESLFTKVNRHFNPEQKDLTYRVTELLDGILVSVFWVGSQGDNSNDFKERLTIIRNKITQYEIIFDNDDSTSEQIEQLRSMGFKVVQPLIFETEKPKPTIQKEAKVSASSSAEDSKKAETKTSSVVQPLLQKEWKLEDVANIIKNHVNNPDNQEYKKAFDAFIENEAQKISAIKSGNDVNKKNKVIEVMSSYDSLLRVLNCEERKTVADEIHQSLCEELYEHKNGSKAIDELKEQITPEEAKEYMWQSDINASRAHVLYHLYRSLSIEGEKARFTQFTQADYHDQIEATARTLSEETKRINFEDRRAWFDKLTYQVVADIVLVENLPDDFSVRVRKMERWIDVMDETANYGTKRAFFDGLNNPAVRDLKEVCSYLSKNAVDKFNAMAEKVNSYYVFPKEEAKPIASSEVESPSNSKRDVLPAPVPKKKPKQPLQNLYDFETLERVEKVKTNVSVSENNFNTVAAKANEEHSGFWNRLGRRLDAISLFAAISLVAVGIFTFFGAIYTAIAGPAKSKLVVPMQKTKVLQDGPKAVPSSSLEKIPPSILVPSGKEELGANDLNPKDNSENSSAKSSPLDFFDNSASDNNSSSKKLNQPPTAFQPINPRK